MPGKALDARERAWPNVEIKAKELAAPVITILRDNAIMIPS